MASWKCNINPRGRILRGLLGLTTLAGGIYLLLKTDSAFWSTGLCTLGAFAIFEGIKGWCALRAMGVKLPF
ncbi:MAG: hypothetical protein CMO47_09330 [Verrucomicrobiales bacterium]|nr:hypothetical protein [Verrucomicrobiales bacterium]